MTENQPQQTETGIKNEFNVSDEFLEKSGLPRIDQAFLDDYEKRQSWKTFRYRFFYFFRRWCMTIFSISILFPCIALLDKSTISEGLFYTWIGLAAIFMAIVMDCYFVPRAPDQKITVNDIYAYFYDKEYDKNFSPILSTKVVLKRISLGISIFLFVTIVGVTVDFFQLSKLYLDFVVFGSAIICAFLFFYKIPSRIFVNFVPDRSWPPDLNVFLKNNIIFGNLATGWLCTPYLIGLLIYLAYILFGIFVALIPNGSKIPDITGFELIIFPTLRLLAILIFIMVIHMSIVMVSGLKYLAFANELIKFSRKERHNL